MGAPPPTPVTEPPPRPYRLGPSCIQMQGSKERPGKVHGTLGAALSGVRTRGACAVSRAELSSFDRCVESRQMGVPLGIVGSTECRRTAVILAFSDFRVDLSRRQLWHHGQLIDVTPTTFDLLAAFLEAPGEVLEREVLLKRVWHDRHVEEGILTHYVSQLRRVLGGRRGEFIVTSHRRGYRFVAAVSPGDDTDHTRPDIQRPTSAEVSLSDDPLLSASHSPGAGDKNAKAGVTAGSGCLGGTVVVVGAQPRSSGTSRPRTGWRRQWQSAGVAVLLLFFTGTRHSAPTVLPGQNVQRALSSRMGSAELTTHVAPDEHPGNQQKVRTLRMAAPDWPPYFADGGGLARELIEACLPSDVRPQYAVLDLDSTFVGLQTGQLDAHVLARTERRAAFLHFGRERLFSDAYHLILRKGDSLPRQLSDLDGRRIGTIVGSRSAGPFRRYIASRQGRDIVELETYPALLYQLADGRIDAFVGLPSTIAVLAKRHGLGDRIVVSPWAVSRHDYYLAVSRSSARVRDPDRFLAATDDCVRRLKTTS
jgi:DNA-binding winged helix-turn-helix (wHTH) protein/ABC-type amino acid transport substrate-binding protein